MPYLPEDYTHQTGFPTAYGKDLALQVRMINEQYRRMYPQLPYYCLERDITPGSDAPGDVTEPIGEAGHTAWDPLWGESIDTTIGATGEWAQPHGDAVDNAVAVEVFATPVNIHGRVQREMKDRELKKLGFDEMRDIIVFFPHGLLDALGITVYAGDEFIWDGDRYLVKQHKSGGYWKNTNIRLYRVCNCEMVRSGS